MEAAVCGGAFAQIQAHDWAPAQEVWAQLLSAGILPSRVNSGTPPAAAGRDKPSTCQVPGCCADLSTEKLYCMRKRICSKHMQAPYLEYPGNTLYRYCFQCAKVEPLACFDGTKRSCRQALHKRKLRTMANPMQQAQQASSASAAAAAAAAPAFVKFETRQGNPLALQLQQQAQLLQQQQAAAAAAAELQQLQQLQRQQQQQMVPPVSAAEVQQLAALTSSLTAAAEQMQNMLSATRTQMRSRSNSPGAHILDLQQQQYVAPMTGYPSPEAVVADSSSRTPSPRSVDTTFAPAGAAVGPAGGDLLDQIERTLAAVGNNTAAAAATTAAAAAAGATSAAAAVADSDFDSFLETLLDDLPETGPDASLASSVPTCSSGGGSASLSSQGFPPILGGGCASLEPTLPAALTSTPGYVTMHNAYNAAGAAGPSALEGMGSGLSSDSCSTGMGVGAMLAESRARTQQQLQYLTAALHQVQSSLMALTQTAQARY